MLDHVVAAGISALYEDPWPNTDHRSLFVDIDELGLFGATISTIPPPIRRTITSKSKTIITKFIDNLEQTNSVDKLLSSLQQLAGIPTWTKSHHETIEQLDAKFTELLLQAEHTCAAPCDFPWSPTIHKAALVYQLWVTKLNGTKNKIDISEQANKIINMLDIEDIYQGDKNRSITKQVQHARKQLINSRLRAEELREHYLDILQQQSIDDGNGTKAEAIRQLANKERQSRCWRTFKLLRQGKNGQGGITHLLVPSKQPDNDSFQRIFDKTEVDNTLLDRNIDHFAQADGTPFTTSPLLDLLGEDGCSDAAMDILEGIVPTHLPKYPKLLLTKLKRVRDPITLEFTYNDMCNGFAKWREKTTTSPSVKHLGIYRALISADRYLTPTQAAHPNDSPSTANKCLHIQHLLMTLAIQHCHTYQRWTIVHDFLLEKIPGVPRLDKLRVIHLYEADWSLIQKFFVAYKLNKLASTQNTIPIDQAGGRPGRSAIELAASRVLMYETIRIQRLSGAVLYNDAKACYDRVIENVSNLALMKQGLPKPLAKLHAQTFHQIKYFIKNKLGIGDTSHSHRKPKPIYGVGQGSTDAPSRWGFVCDPLLEIYKELAADAHITSPLSNTTTNNKIAGFVDDTATLMIQHYSIMLYIIIIIQRDAQTWEKLLHTSGGRLEISKCVFALFSWTFDSWGRAILSDISTNSVHLKSSETQQPSTIPQMSTTTAYKYVGVQLALDGNMKTQIQDLQQKCNDMGNLLSCTYFNAKDANQGYTTVFTPSIKYVLPVTSISTTKLQQLQRPNTNAVLSRLGYNPHMPRAVVFASKTKGGIGLLNLPTEQGASQAQLLISHVRAKSYLCDTIIILVETFQLATGLATSPLIDTSSRNYVDSPWLTSVRQFLHNIQATIEIPTLKTLVKHRLNDQTIMNNTIRHFPNQILNALTHAAYSYKLTSCPRYQTIKALPFFPKQ